jgi:ABC-type lipoprotein export system ATPase subunit
MIDAVAKDTDLVCLDNVSRVFKKAGTEVVALCDISLRIGQGERVALLGRSGSGKSTLLNLLAGLDQPTSGSITVAGEDIAKHSSDQLAAYRMNQVGVVFQAFHLIQSLTAQKNVELPYVFASVDRKTRSVLATKSLKAVGLADRANHLPLELSGGEQQRVALARALANGPKLILADEPTGNLDSSTATQIVDYLSAYAQANQATVILVTHDEELAAGFSQRVIRLHDGKLVAPSTGSNH